VPAAEAYAKYAVGFRIAPNIDQTSTNPT